jgi:hypothetical protein
MAGISSDGPSTIHYPLRRARCPLRRILQVAFSLREKWANSESARPYKPERNGDHSIAFIGQLLGEARRLLSAQMQAVQPTDSFDQRR